MIRTAPVARGSHVSHVPHPSVHTAPVYHITRDPQVHHARPRNPNGHPAVASTSHSYGLDTTHHAAVHHSKSDPSQSRTPTRKYFYEEACTAFNLSPSDRDSDVESSNTKRPAYRAVVNELSETISRANSMEIRTSKRQKSNNTRVHQNTQIPNGNGQVKQVRQKRMAPLRPDCTTSHVTGTHPPAMRSRSYPGEPVLDDRLREFAQNELEKINEQISILFQGSNVCTKTHSRPTSYV